MRRGAAALLLLSGALQGCSVLVYTPVVVGSALGLHRTDLSEQPPYRDYVGRTFRVATEPTRKWSLHKFSEGRYFIQPYQANAQTEFVCDLAGAQIAIDQVFYDDNYASTMFAAGIVCDGKDIKAPLNDWSDELAKLWISL